ncbi:unnamed protein product [Moneuplotes crassus]|uniref:Uncharacterized protein n=1 Tax=Euplotes crassus TaxID=5936 RepID=A0AAD1U8G3_EUPCR|nr:unnamed protein product [Moneuplotes crassus]
MITLGLSEIISKWKGENYFNWKTSCFRNPTTGGFCWLNLLGTALYSLIMISISCCVYFTFRCALYADINQGILTSIFGLSSLISAVLAYFMFGDRLKKYHVSICDNL